MRLLLTLIVFLSSFWIAAQNQSLCVQSLQGEVRDKMTNELLPNAIITLSDKEGNATTQLAKEDAKFSFEIQCGTEYKLEGKKEEYTSESKVFITSSEANKQLKLLVLLGKGDIGFITYNKKVETKVKDVTLDSITNAIADVDVVSVLDAPALQALPKEEPELPKDIVEVHVDRYIPNLDAIYFEYESSYLTKQAKRQLLEIVTMMRENPKIVIECAAHTDAKGSEEYNQWMSERRIKRAIDYIVSKGIDDSRIYGEGYGESHLMNNCTNDVECTDKERAVNRRAEFVIVKM